MHATIANLVLQNGLQMMNSHLVLIKGTPFAIIGLSCFAVLDTLEVKAGTAGRMRAWKLQLTSILLEMLGRRAAPAPPSAREVPWSGMSAGMTAASLTSLLSASNSRPTPTAAGTAGCRKHGFCFSSIVQ